MPQGTTCPRQISGRRTDQAKGADKPPLFLSGGALERKEQASPFSALAGTGKEHVLADPSKKFPESGVPQPTSKLRGTSNTDDGAAQWLRGDNEDGFQGWYFSPALIGAC